MPTDFVVAGIGVTPAVELFQRTALDTDDGIKVNKFLETSVPGVWAAGDIANYPDQVFHRRMRVEHWDNAVEQGRVAMRNLMGKIQPFIHVPYFFSDAFDLSYEFWGDADGPRPDRLSRQHESQAAQLLVARTSLRFLITSDQFETNP